MDDKDTLRKLLATGKHADLIIRCGPNTFNVHKCIVCLRSGWFDKACEVGRWQEGQENFIDLAALDEDNPIDSVGCDDPEAVKLMIDFIYLGDYVPKVKQAFGSVAASDIQASSTSLISPGTELDVTSQSVDGDKRPKKKPNRSGFTWKDACNQDLPLFVEANKSYLTTHSKMYALGAKYIIPELMKVSVEKLRSALDNRWNRADFAMALEMAFDDTPEIEQGSQDAFIKAILRRPVLFTTDSTLATAIKGIEGLSFDLFERQSRQKGPQLANNSSTATAS